MLNDVWGPVVFVREWFSLFRPVKSSGNRPLTNGVAKEIVGSFLKMYLRILMMKASSPIRPALMFLLGFVLVAGPSMIRADDEALAALVQVLKESDDPAFQRDILRGMSLGLEGRRNVPQPEGWAGLEERLIASPNEEVRRLAQSLALIFGSRRALDALRARLQDRSAGVQERRQALSSLLAAKDPNLVPVLKRLLDEPPLRSAALRGLAAYDDGGIPRAILKIYDRLGTAEKRDALSTLASRSSFAQTLLEAVAEKTISARDLSADVVRQLRNLKDDSITQKVAEVWGVVRQSPEAKVAEIERFKKLVRRKVRRKPDLSHGRALFARACQQCHILYGVGGKIGPDITGSNRADLDYILHNIVDPNAEIPNDYLTSSIETKDDRVITGIITRQDSETVTALTQNETLTLPRSEIAEIFPSQLSMMPEGLLATFSPNDVRDLVGYLRHSRQVPMLATPDTSAFFFNGEDLSGWDGNPELWSVEKGEIVGRSPGIKKNEFLVGPLKAGDFKLTLEVKLVENKGNSGIQFRSEVIEGGSVKGYQADVGAGWWGKLYEEHGRALLWKKSGEEHVRKEEWNRYEIVARGDRIRTFINGGPCVDLEDPEGAREGIIAFQLHSGGPTEVRFRNLELEVLGGP